MRGTIYRQWLVLIAVIGITASISSAVPVSGDVPVSTFQQRSSKYNVDQLYGQAGIKSVRKRASHPSMVVATEPEYLEEKSHNPLDGLFSTLSTKELLRMLELLDMVERKQPIDASEAELTKLIELLNYSQRK